MMAAAARLLAALLVFHTCAVPGPELAAQPAERRLSRSDRRYWQGTLASAGAPRNELYVFVHIPKAAGASFLKDSPRHVAAGSRVKGSHEKSVHHAYTAGLLAKPASSSCTSSSHRENLLIFSKSSEGYESQGVHSRRGIYSEFVPC